MGVATAPHIPTQQQHPAAAKASGAPITAQAQSRTLPVASGSAGTAPVPGGPQVMPPGPVSFGQPPVGGGANAGAQLMNPIVGTPYWQNQMQQHPQQTGQAFSPPAMSQMGSLYPPGFGSQSGGSGFMGGPGYGSSYGGGPGGGYWGGGPGGGGMPGGSGGGMPGMFGGGK
jgi:hypothetical protein